MEAFILMAVKILFGKVHFRDKEFLNCSFFIKIYYRDFSTKYRVDLDQTPRFAASEFGLYCLPLSLLWDARHKWVNSNPKESIFG